MSLHARLMLFVLSALATVIIPAVMVSTYHTIDEIAPEGSTAIMALGMVPLAITMLMCFIGLFFAIFRTGNR